MNTIFFIIKAIKRKVLQTSIQKNYSISETRIVFTIPFSLIGIDAKLMVKSPVRTYPFSCAILLMSSIVTSVLSNLSYQKAVTPQSRFSWVNIYLLDVNARICALGRHAEI